jgi:nickel/cobalt transporter (NicO) family protein
MRRRLLLAVAGAGLAALGVVLPATMASAHPLGNASVNTYTGIVVSTTHVNVDEVLDLAELPTVQARQHIDTDDDGQVSTAEADA